MSSSPRRVRRSLVPTGLRWRLAGWVALVTLICTGIAFVAVYGGTGSELRHQIDGEIEGDAGELAHSLALARAHNAAQLAQAATHYVRNQPFKASSMLLFAVIPGGGTSTNRPELFGAAAADNGESAGAQGHEDHLAGGLLRAGQGFSTLWLTDVGDVRLLKRTITLPTGLRVTVGVGEPLATVGHAQRGVANAFILAGILALAGALFAAYLVSARVSRPLRRMAAVAARVDAGDLHPRIRDVGGHGDEVEVLAEAFNHMLDRLTDAFAGQRAFVADASHELRTPLTVVRGQLELLASQPNPSGEEVRRVERLAQAEIARISRLVDDLLLLAKTEQPQSLRLESLDLATYVSELWDGITLLARRRFELGELPQGSLRADPDQLAQALRNLASNAIAHTAGEHGLVRLEVERVGAERVRFLVDDDGPGIPLAQRERIFERFHRTDSARDRASGGTGLGLAIVRAIAAAHGGTVSAGESPEGGARVALELPGFTAAERRAARAPAQAAASQPITGMR